MIVVLGADGLLGSWLLAKHPRETVGFTHKELDITDSEQVFDKLEGAAPEAVINCAGITRLGQHTVDEVVSVNALAPHRLATVCDLLGIRLVQVSTDSVFSGAKGNYAENSKPDASDLYGTTKYRGEVTRTPHVTVRTSFIGWPDPKGRGLLAWLHSKQGQQVQGYANALWNGLCVTELSNALVEIAYGHQRGIIHVHGEPITKYEVLQLVRDAYGWSVSIEPVDTPKVDKTLASNWSNAFKITKPLEDQILEMVAWEKKYNKFHGVSY